VIDDNKYDTMTDDYDANP